MGLASKMKEAQAAEAARLAQGGAAPPIQQGYASPTGPPPAFQQQQQQQQQQFASPVGPPPGHPAAATSAQQHRQQTVDPKLVVFNLTHAVKDKLEHFYPDARSIDAIAQRVVRSGAVEQLARSWNLPLEAATGFCRLALYDTVVLADDSGSMKAGDRIEDLKVILSKIATACSLFDDDGISLRALNTKTQADGVKNEAGAHQFVSNLEYVYDTRLGTILDAKILQPMVVQPARRRALQKPVLVLVITDGAPQGEPANKLEKVIVDANKELKGTKYGGGAVAYQFAQVGDDKEAQDFLSSLDDHKKIGHLVDQTMGFEYEQDEMMRKTRVALTPEMWLRKMLLGAIDSSLDSQDEADKPKRKGLFGKLLA